GERGSQANPLFLRERAGGEGETSRKEGIDIRTRRLGRNVKKWVTGTLVFALAAFAGAASRPAEEQSKIDWLLDQIGGSGAIFIRNGQEYEAKKAVSHLKQKLWFAGRRVQTARDFIAGCATHSEQSGKTYEIPSPTGSRGGWPSG